MTPELGAIVHVRVETAGRCYPGIVIVPGPVVSRVRVLHPSGGGLAAPGLNDEEGDVRDHPVMVPNPDHPDGTPGGKRTLDWWHGPVNCPDRIHPKVIRSRP